MPWFRSGGIVCRCQVGLVWRGQARQNGTQLRARMQVKGTDKKSTTSGEQCKEVQLSSWSGRICCIAGWCQGEERF